MAANHERRPARFEPPPAQSGGRAGTVLGDLYAEMATGKYERAALKSLIRYLTEGALLSHGARAKPASQTRAIFILHPEPA